MPTINRQDIDELNAILTLEVTPEDYADKVKEQFKTLRKKASLKGFRAGQVPLSMIKKMYGKGVVYEIINDVVAGELESYLKNNLDGKETLGQPMPHADEETAAEFTVDTTASYKLKFKVGFAPAFELKGYDASTVLPGYEISVATESLDQEIENLRSRLGETINPTDDIQDKDIITLDLQELDGEAIKENGIKANTTVSAEDLHESIKANVLTMKKGDRFNVNIYELDGKMSKPESVRKYLLSLEDDSITFGDHFVATIEEVRRVVPVEEFTAEVIQKAIPNAGGDLQNEADLRAYIEQDIKKYYDDQVDKLFLARLQRHLMEINDFNLPDDFLKEWLVTSDEKATPESVAAQYDSFAQGLRWSLIQSRIAEAEKIEVTQQDLEGAVKEELSNYFGGQVDDAMVANMIGRFMEDREYVNRTAERIMNNKIVDAAKNVITLEATPVTEKAFNDIVKAYNEEFNTSNVAADADLAAEVEEVVADATEEA